jgi:hypothetical protein
MWQTNGYFHSLIPKHLQSFHCIDTLNACMYFWCRRYPRSHYKLQSKSRSFRTRPSGSSSALLGLPSVTRTKRLIYYTKVNILCCCAVDTWMNARQNSDQEAIRLNKWSSIALEFSRLPSRLSWENVLEGETGNAPRVRDIISFAKFFICYCIFRYYLTN